ncbi:hypothetical protein QYE76_060493 [Lolium multiflorum]|uniref:Arabidopsis retrotransposon Orf1 C-terminal domain-containing protein n=1 Tax=Lolium multiflorum TaxID=4521 RepID=A0AAD8S0I2_LOLMU|nr:hypothetical protein QYE76_060493 [Lolium multiflorum]
MGKPRDTKIAILPSTTRKGTILNTSAALDSPSVIDKLVSPPHASHAGTSAESEHSHNIDNVSAVLDDSGSLGSFLDATIARSRQIENTETPNATTPVSSPELGYFSDDPEEDYVELNDDFIEKCNATTDARKIKKLLAEHAVRYKLSPDPKFATSPINIRDKDYDFSLDLSHIAIVEKTPFCGTEKESAVEHMTELSTLSSLFSDDVKKRTYFVAKIFPFSLKDDAKTWKRTPDDAEELLAKISRNHDDWTTPEPTPTPILKKRGLIKLNDEDMREAKKSLKEKGNNSKEKHAYEVTTRGGVSTQDPLYPEGHPKRVEQDSQRIEPSAHSRKKKKKKHKNVVESSEPVNDPNSISISDAETESGNEHDNDNDNDKNDTPDKEEVEEEPEKHAKNKKEAMKKFSFGELFKKGTTSTGRPSRAATRIRQSYNEDILAPSFAPEEDNGPPNASTFPCYDFLRNAGILEDFLTLVNRAGLTTYMGDEREQYYLLTKIFVESFQFNNKHYEPTVAFRIYGNTVTMPLKDFCCALDIAPVGTASRIDDNPRDLLELYRGITDDDCRTIQRGKIRNIQLPAIKYFAYYIATSILGRENTSNISSYHLAFLNIALTGQTSYHLGALIARRLTTKGPIFGGTIALRVLTYLNLPIDPNDVPLAPRRLDIIAMKSHHFVTTDSTLDSMVYRMLFSDGEEKEIPLPQLSLLSIDRQSWSCTKEEVDEHLKIRDFHQQHDSEDVGTSYDHTVTYPGASSSTYPEYDPSSYYGDTTSWDRWD